MKRVVCIFALMFICCCAVPGISASEEKEESIQLEQEKWYIGPRVGFSTFTGILGVEIQYVNVALTIGLPECIGIKYYLDFPNHSWFIGAYFSRWDTEDDETKGGITYDKETNTEGGIGVGFRWRWRNGWDLSIGVSGEYGEEELTNSSATRTETSYRIKPCISVGYSF